MDDQNGSVCSEKSYDSIRSVQAVIHGHRHCHRHPHPHRHCHRHPHPHHCRRSYRTDFSSAQPISKQPRFSLDPPIDLISTLPDLLLQEILSFLPIEDVIKTSILSHRWKPLWTQMPILSFTHSRSSFKLGKFTDFIDKTLEHFNGPKIRKFMLNFKFTESMASCLEKWVDFAINHGVEILKLDFDGGSRYAPFGKSTPYYLPQFLYRSSSLKDLTLRQCHVSTHCRVYWPFLKDLAINYSRLNDEAIENVLSGTPNLQKLELCNCEGVNRISSNSLEVIVIDGIYGTYEKCVTHISCPNLRSLSLLGFMYRRTYRLMHASKLAQANLSFVMMTMDRKYKYDCTNYRDILRELLEKLCHVEKLTVGTWCLEVLSIWEIKGISSPLLKQDCLMLETEICEWDLPGIVSLLQSSPYLKKLVINLSPYDSSKFEFDQHFFDMHKFEGETFLTSTDKIFKCFQQSLEYIKIIGFQPRSLVPKHLKKFMHFLLNSSKVLKVVNIYEESGTLLHSWESSGNKNMNHDEKSQILEAIKEHSSDAINL